jgi:hypothetical protein
LLLYLMGQQEQRFENGPIGNTINSGTRHQDKPIAK